MSGMFDDLMATDTDQPKVDEVKADEATTENAPQADAVKADETASETAQEAGRETITVESLDALPDGYVDVKTFAWELTKANLASAQNEGRTPGPEDMVDTQAVYAATRNKRWSLPALEAVTADGTKLGVVIPLTAGLSAWNERPERGTGTGGGAAMTPERRATRILRAGKTKALYEKLGKRMERLTTLLKEVGATWEDADEAYNQFLETEDGKKEIADSNKEDNGNE